jgi:hypothetical protein
MMYFDAAVNQDLCDVEAAGSQSFGTTGLTSFPTSVCHSRCHWQQQQWQLQQQ